MDIEGRILQSLRPRKDGILLRADIKGIGSPSQVSAALKSLQSKGLVVRMDRGVYAKPDVASRVSDVKSFVRAILARRGVSASAQQVRRQLFQANPTARRVRALAAKAGVRYRPSYADVWASAVTKLAGDDVRSDQTDDLLVALGRAGTISDTELLKLFFKHHKELKGV
jgi:hypothetical protein